VCNIGCASRLVLAAAIVCNCHPRFRATEMTSSEDIPRLCSTRGGPLERISRIFMPWRRQSSVSGLTDQRDRAKWSTQGSLDPLLHFRSTLRRSDATRCAIRQGESGGEYHEIRTLRNEIPTWDPNSIHRIAFASSLSTVPVIHGTREASSAHAGTHPVAHDNRYTYRLRPAADVIYKLINPMPHVADGTRAVISPLALRGLPGLHPGHDLVFLSLRNAINETLPVS